MPRGFLIKRKKHQSETWINRRGSEEWDASSESGSDQMDKPMKRYAHEDINSSGALDLCIKRSKTVFDQGLDLTAKHTTGSSDNDSDALSDGLDSKKSDSDDVDTSKTPDDDVISRVSKKLHLKQQHHHHQPQGVYREFNNNTLLGAAGSLYRHTLGDYNRANFKHYLPSALPTSNHRSLSISTAQANWSPFYLAAFDHLSVSVSPSSNGSSHGSPQDAPSLHPPSYAASSSSSPTVTSSSTSSSLTSPSTLTQQSVDGSSHVTATAMTLPAQIKQTAQRTAHTTAHNNNNNTTTATTTTAAATSPVKKRTNSSSNAKSVNNNNSNKASSSKKQKAVRKIEFDDSSPVSGTYIREETDEEGIRVVSGDIDTNLNIVEVTPEAEAELAKIDNKIGDYRCRLCKETFENAFGLAQHRCSRIVHVEYRCPECDKVFNCSANLASHRRWHKPRSQQQMGAKLPKLLPNGQIDPESNRNFDPDTTGQFPCRQCPKIFKRQAYLKKHMATHSGSNSHHQQHSLNHHHQQQQQHPEQRKPTSFHAMLGADPAANSPRLGLLHQQIPSVPGSLNAISPGSSSSSALVCPICSTAVQDTIALEEHVRHHHTEVFPCKLCSSTFYSLPGLSSHLSKCHPSLDHPVMLQIPTFAPRPC